MENKKSSRLFKNYLLLYTGILFTVHLGVYVISLITGSNIYVFPILFVQNSGIILMILSLPFALLCDFIIVSIILSFLYYYKKDFRLPWFDGFKDTEEIKRRKLSIIAGVFVLIIYSFIYIKYGTIFMIFSLNNGKLITYSIMSEPLHVVSVLILIIMSVSFLSLILKHFYYPAWFDILISVIRLSLFLAIVKIINEKNTVSNGEINFFINDKNPGIPVNHLLSGLVNAFTVIFVIISIIAAINLVKKIINLLAGTIGKL